MHVYNIFLIPLVVYPFMTHSDLQAEHGIVRFAPKEVSLNPVCWAIAAKSTIVACYGLLWLGLCFSEVLHVWQELRYCVRYRQSLWLIYSILSRSPVSRALYSLLRFQATQFLLEYHKTKLLRLTWNNEELRYVQTCNESHCSVWKTTLYVVTRCVSLKGQGSSATFFVYAYVINHTQRNTHGLRLSWKEFKRLNCHFNPLFSLNI